MSYKIIASMCALLVLTACGNSGDTETDSSNPELSESIAALESELYNDAASFDPATAAKLMNAYVDYEAANPEDPQSPDYKFRAAEIAMNLGDYQRSLVYFRSIYTDYPEYRNRPLALFFQANIYDDKLHNYEKAGELYKEFLKSHPDHDFADDVNILLDNLGKSDEELLRQFQENAGS